jgi:hypothetical protein
MSSFQESKMRICMFTLIRILYLSGTSFSQLVMTDDEPPIVPDGTIGCFTEVNILCSDAPSRPSLTLCGERKCIIEVTIDEDTGLISKSWVCPVPREFSVGVFAYPRIKSAANGAAGRTEFFNYTKTCGIETPCKCPDTQPPSFQLPASSIPNCSALYSNAGPGFTVEAQLTMGPNCLGTGGDGPPEPPSTNNKP